MVIEATFDIRTILSEVRKVIHQNLPVESYINFTTLFDLYQT